MEKEVIRRNAFVYLTQNVNEAPESIKRFVAKAAEYISTGERLFGVINEAQKTIEQAKDEITQTQGAVSALIDLSCEQMDESDLNKFAELGAEFIKKQEPKGKALK